MINEKELIEKHGMTVEELLSLKSDAESYASGNWPEGKTTLIGRPTLYDGDNLENVTFRMRKSRLQAVDRAAKEAGESRSEFLREAIDKALAGIA